MLQSKMFLRVHLESIRTVASLGKFRGRIGGLGDRI